MKKQICLFMLLVLATSAVPKSVFAQPLSRSQRQLIQTKVDNTKESFDLIIGLNYAKQSKETALFYRQLWLEKQERALAQHQPTNAKLEAEYAFASTVALAFSPLDLKESAHQSLLRKELQSYSLITESYRKEAFKALPDDAGVLLMNSVSEEQLAHFKQAVELAERAYKKEPQWAYARFWCGRSRIELAGKSQEAANTSKLFIDSLVDLQEAERLDPGFSQKTANLYFAYVHANVGLKRYDKALVYVDRLIARVQARRPVNTKELEFLKSWRTEFVAKTQ